MLEKLNIKKNCERYGLPLYKCPDFLFPVLGVFIVAVVIVTYWVGESISAHPLIPLILLGIILIEALVLLLFAFAIVNGFRKMAEANRMKEDFIDLIVHQIRSPLVNLRWGFEELVSDRETKEKWEETLSSLQGNVGRISEMVDNLLYISQIDHEGVEFKSESFSLKNLIEEVLREYKGNDSRVNIKSFVEDASYVKSDPSQLKIVMDNLVSNAVKYTDRGGDVEVRLKEEKERFIFSVKDSGIGIPKEEQKKVFEKFERASNVCRTKKPGSGLGLFLAREIMKKLEGDIGFESKQGEGTTFWISIPKK